MTESEKDLINAIKSGDVDATLREFSFFICGDDSMNTIKLMALIQTGAILKASDTIQCLAAIFLKVSQLAIKYEDREK